MLEENPERTRGCQSAFPLLSLAALPSFSPYRPEGGSSKVSLFFFLLHCLSHVFPDDPAVPGSEKGPSDPPCVRRLLLTNLCHWIIVFNHLLTDK